MRVGNIIYFEKKTTNKANYEGKKQTEKSTITGKINEIPKEKYEKKVIKCGFPRRVLDSYQKKEKNEERKIIHYQVKDNNNNNEFGFFISILVILILYSR